MVCDRGISGALDTENRFQICHQVVVRQTIKSHCEKIKIPLGLAVRIELLRIVAKLQLCPGLYAHKT